MPINYDHFKTVDLRTAKILSAERVTGSEKLIRLELEAGDKDITGEALRRQIVAGIGTAYEPESLVGQTIVIVANLEPRKLMGVESNGMLLAARDESGAPVILTPQRDVPPGTNVS
jgi:methionyl-tRNA synthetase